MTTKKVLLIEDDKFLVRVYEAKLQKEGFETAFLEEGTLAEETVKKERPDVIVLDLVMPFRDGFRTLKGLKADAQTKDVPVIVLTALKSEADKQNCLALGAREYLEKDTVAIADVIQLIRKYI